MLKKALVSIIGGGLTLLGIALLALPGPAWLLLPIGLAVLSLEFPWAKVWLRKSQRQFYSSAAWLDRKILLRKMKN
ncbi:PGPGW domain-containing protein [Shewanella eurypsychrophilus]|uniref:PGPGW domain-containing protein n=1 Tax=Shewanella eurypsychrophilus TaxID=2593656 RepID=A0ABX6V4Y0_9GAMM|nr:MULTISPECIES: PGPGW domain-containing protein [Shewanella]QFU22420.1 tellurium resistance protein TerC [Shewanella sp. YLB-09]QPG57707.1 PGPGW domain-containing protein [Shewanella eurypsychrophilus]